MHAHAQTGGSISAARQRVLRVMNGVLIMVVVSLFLQIAGCVSPGWVVMEYEGTSLNYGLWFGRWCAGDECVTKSIDEFDDQFSSPVSLMIGLSEYRGETISALIMCLAAIVSIRVSRTRLYTPGSNNALTWLLVASISVLLTGILATVAAGKFGDNLRTTADTLKAMNYVNMLKFPYALFLTGVGGLLALIAFLALLSRQPWTLQAETQPQPQQPSPQTVLYPAQAQVNAVAYPQGGQPQMYAMAAPAPSAPGQDKSANAPPAYYY